MKYVLGIILALIVIVGIIAAVHLYRVSVKNKKEMAQYAGKSAEVKNNLGKVLVVYYSLSGHTKDIAEKIAVKTGADLFEIKTKEPYPTGAKLYTTSKKEIKNKQYPAVEALPDVAAYDVVFVGERHDLRKDDAESFDEKGIAFDGKAHRAVTVKTIPRFRLA